MPARISCRFRYPIAYTLAHIFSLPVAMALALSCVAPACAQPGCDTLPRQIRTMIDRDQELRWRVDRLEPGDSSLDAELLQIDTRHTAELKEIIARCGWPDAARYDAPTTHAAWLLAQHADQDVEFQLQVLRLIKDNAIRDDIGRKEFAYLTDRIALKQTGKQVYGTQLTIGPSGEPALPAEEIDSEQQVDRRRAEIGLPAVREYLRTAAEKMARIRAGKE